MDSTRGETGRSLSPARNAPGAKDAGAGRGARSRPRGAFSTAEDALESALRAAPPSLAPLPVGAQPFGNAPPRAGGGAGAESSGPGAAVAAAALPPPRPVEPGLGPQLFGEDRPTATLAQAFSGPLPGSWAGSPGRAMLLGGDGRRESGPGRRSGAAAVPLERILVSVRVRVRRCLWSVSW